MPDASSPDSLDALCERLAASNEAAFEALFDRLGSPVFRFISGMVGTGPQAHDLTQETFVRLWEAREQMDEVQSPKAYVFQIARNRVYSHERSERTRRERRAERSPSSSGGAIPSPDDAVDTEALEDKMQAWISALPERQREALLLAREQGLSHDKIAQVMGISPSTVNNHIVKAMSTLRDRLNEYRPDLL
ncbi:RNA polymerase sigma factor [Salinibacter grassmerensis]|uniref:RNA polymerase sigma factor n=1 Tax=Salinibacter grassmerensis TaxID=3040353 RepID=UPI0021E8D4D0|nr:RNA polymerase sigma factor [Salinibacter grassmerensis]